MRNHSNNNKHHCPNCGPINNTVEFTGIDQDMDGKYCTKCMLVAIHRSVPKVNKSRPRSYKRKKPIAKFHGRLEIR